MRSIFKTMIDKRKNGIKLPIAVHLYFVLIFVILSIGFIAVLFFNQLIIKYIEEQCNTRINNAIASCNILSEKTSRNNPAAYNFSEDFLSELAKSTEITNNANLLVIYEKNGQYNRLWPENLDTANLSGRSEKKIINLLSENKYDFDSKNATAIKTNEESILFRITKVNYVVYGDILGTNVYIVFYVNTASYTAFTHELNDALLKIVFISILLSAILCIIISFPIIISIYKMSRFAKRIAKGDFAQNNDLVISREMQDLSDNMNYMAKKLEENDKEQKIFFQNVSHELRTPLMSIQGYAEGLKYDIFQDEEKQNATEVILDECNRLSGMVENLLAISKMDLAKRGNYTVTKTQLSLYELINHEIENIRGTMLHCNKNLVQTIDVDDKFIFANENDILRMLDNIFSNCIRYADRNIYFNSTTEDKNVLFQIYDDGCGLSDEIKSKLFTRFAKGDDGKHGIGLSLVKAIAEEHKGNVKAYNKEGFGACFEIRIPCYSAETQLSDRNKKE